MLQINETLSLSPGSAPFSITDAARARIAHLLSDEPAGTRFWVMVDGGGCSGFQYHFDLSARAPNEGDLLLAADNVVVDEVAIPMLKDAVLDYVEDLAQAGFEIRNPNATARCGCGNSFSVKF